MKGTCILIKTARCFQLRWPSFRLNTTSKLSHCDFARNCEISSYPFENTQSFLRSRDRFVFCNIGSHPEKNTKNKSNTIMGMFASVCVIALQMPKERLLFIPVFSPQSCPTFTLSTYLLQLIIGSTYFQIWKYLEGNR